MSNWLNNAGDRAGLWCQNAGELLQEKPWLLLVVAGAIVACFIWGYWREGK